LEEFYQERADGVLLESRDTLGYMKFAFDALEDESNRADKYMMPDSKKSLMHILILGKKIYK
jgi:hypothetical protein